MFFPRGPKFTQLCSHECLYLLRLSKRSFGYSWVERIGHQRWLEVHTEGSLDPTSCNCLEEPQPIFLLYINTSVWFGACYLLSFPYAGPARGCYLVLLTDTALVPGLSASALETAFLISNHRNISKVPVQGGPPPRCQPKKIRSYPFLLSQGAWNQRLLELRVFIFDYVRDIQVWHLVSGNYSPHCSVSKRWRGWLCVYNLTDNSNKENPGLDLG